MEQNNHEQNFESFYNSEGFFTAKQLFDLNITELPKLWDPYLRKMGILFLAGSSDATKTTFCRQFALSIAKGDKLFLEYSLNASHKRVCIISTEDDEESVGYSIRKQMLQDKEHEYANRIGFLFINKNYSARVEEVLSKCPCDLIILDSWGDIMEGNTNSYSDVRQALNPYHEIAIKYRCLILIIHHTKKNSEYEEPSKNNVNGSQGLEAKARCVLEMRLDSKDNDLRLLTVLKSNYLSNTEKQSSLKLKFNEETRTFTNTLEKVVINGGSSRKRVDTKLVWMEDLLKLKIAYKFSYKKAYEELKVKYPQDLTIGLTQFKTISKPFVDARETYLRSKKSSAEVLEKYISNNL